MYEIKSILIATPCGCSYVIGQYECLLHLRLVELMQNAIML